jgi:hypothetical protein
MECLGAAILVTYAPDPRQLVYVVLLVVSAVEAFILWSTPETAQLRARALASLRPRISVPARARDVLVRVTPVTVASWTLGGFYFSLMPALVRLATKRESSCHRKSRCQRADIQRRDQRIGSTRQRRSVGAFAESKFANPAGPVR